MSLKINIILKYTAIITLQDVLCKPYINQEKSSKKGVPQKRRKKYKYLCEKGEGERVKHESKQQGNICRTERKQ